MKNNKDIPDKDFFVECPVCKKKNMPKNNKFCSLACYYRQ